MKLGELRTIVLAEPTMQEPLHGKGDGEQSSRSTSLCDLHPDVVLALLHRLDADSGDPMEGAQRVLRMRATCRYFASTLAGEEGRALLADVLARRQTDVQPRLCAPLTPYPHCNQLLLHAQSANRLKAIRWADDVHAFHCASECCSGARREAGRKMQRLLCGSRVSAHAVTPSARSMAAAADGSTCFVHEIAIDESRKSVHYLSRYTMRTQVEKKLDPRLSMPPSVRPFRLSGRVPLDSETMHRSTGIMSMSAAHDGTAVAIVHECGYVLPMEREEERDFWRGHATVVQVWAPRSSSDVMRAGRVTGDEVRAVVAEAANYGHVGDEAREWSSRLTQTLYAQSVWWTDERKLVVAWSSSLVHPMGFAMSRSTDMEAELNGSCRVEYYIATYAVAAHHDRLDFTISNVDGPFENRLLSASASVDGRYVAALRERVHATTGPIVSHATHVWNVPTLTSAIVHTEHLGLAPLVVCADEAGRIGRFRRGRARSPWQPRSIAISPTGDCVVLAARHVDCVSLIAHNPVVEKQAPVFMAVFVRASDGGYTFAAAHDLGECFATCLSVPPSAIALVLQFGMHFSYCGRYVSVVDARARWRISFTGYAACVVDLEWRSPANKVSCASIAETKRMRRLKRARDDEHGASRRRPSGQAVCEMLSRCEEMPNLASSCTPLRCIQWSQHATWIMGHRGLIAVA